MKIPTWGDLLLVPESRSVVRALQRLLQALSHVRQSVDTVNPLLIHGPTGTGKSALLSQFLRDLAELPLIRTVDVCYAHEFAEELEDELLSPDVLAIEDLQHLPSREWERLTHILDERVAHRRITVVTSLVGPAGLKPIPNRLTSRFAAGLVVRMDPPGLASRKLLVKYLSEARSIHLADDAMDFLATSAGFSIRGLVGQLIQMQNLAKRQIEPLTLTDLENLAQESNPHTPKQRPLERIVKRVAKLYGVKPKELLGVCRTRHLLLPRHVAMYLARNIAHEPLTRIGAYFNGRDHSTVLHAVRKIEQSMLSDSQLAGTVRELETEFASG